MATDSTSNIFVSLIEESPARDDPSQLPTDIRIDLQVNLSYHSPDPTIQTSILAPEAHRSRSFRFPNLDDASPESPSRTLISGMISGSELPFPLDNLKWIDVEGVTTPLADEQDLVRKVLESACRGAAEAREGNKKAAMRLFIEKRVILPEREFEAMRNARAAEERNRYLDFCVSWMATQLGVSPEWVYGRFQKEGGGVDLEQWVLRSMMGMASGDLENRWGPSVMMDEMTKVALEPP